jgi:hypothetical protein
MFLMPFVLFVANVDRKSIPVVTLARMSKLSREASIASLHEQSLELISHARRLRQEFAELSETSKLLRLESMQLRDDCQNSA